MLANQYSAMPMGKAVYTNASNTAIATNAINGYNIPMLPINVCSLTPPKKAQLRASLSLTNSLDRLEFLGGVREQTLASMPIPLAYFFNSNADNGSAD